MKRTRLGVEFSWALQPALILGRPDLKRRFAQNLMRHSDPLLPGLTTIQRRSLARDLAKSDEAIWVFLVSGESPSRLPSLEDVAQLHRAKRETWEQFIRRYGLPTLNAAWVRWKGESSRYSVIYLLRIPLRDLRVFCRRAVFLKACMNAAALRERYERYGAFRQLLSGTASSDMVELSLGVPLPQADSDTELASYARQIVKRYLEKATSSMNPVAQGVDRGLPDALAFLGSSWWPAVVIEEVLYRSRNPVRCAAENCSNLVPEERRKGAWAQGRPGAHYCSERCRQREKKRRQRETPR